MRYLALLFAVGCGSGLSIDVELVDPCNQEAVQSVNFLKFEPRGTGVDSEGLTTIQAVEDGATLPIPIPLVSDFQLVATGHVGDFDAPPEAIGVSAKYDLTSADGVVDIRLPFALIDEFYKTTSLEDPTACTTLSHARYGATATYLPENGMVLIVGGARLQDDMLDYPRIVELYNPASGMFEEVAELLVGGARAFHTATRLADGRVLIAGGEALVQFKTQALRSAFIIDARDPRNVTISEGGLAMRKARTGHSATLLDDGRVLLAGGRVLLETATRPEDHTYEPSIELYDSADGVFTLPTDPSGNAIELPEARYGHSATAVSKTDVILAGGQNGDNPVLSLAVVHLAGEAVTVKTSSDAIGVGPLFHAADATSDGTLLLSGGYATIADAEGAPPTDSVRNVEMWTLNEATGELTRLCSSSLNKARGYHTVSIVERQAVFIGGRDDAGLPIADAETASLLGAAGACFARPPETHPMTDPRAQHAVAKIGSGELLVVGGRQQNVGETFGRSIESTEIFSPRRDP
jgi:hypothetical protein